jgi:signal transduction histidine kinase
MEIIRSCLLPALLALGQAALLLTTEVWLEQPLDGVELAAGFAATALAAVALAWRRRAPVVALAGTTAALTLGYLAVSPDAMALISVADIIALYSIGVRRSTPLLAWATAGLVGWQAVLGPSFFPTTTSYVGNVLTAAVTYLLAAGLGHSRQRWLAVRRDAAQRLAQAEAEQRQAASAERRRLARELHDVSAHHLTSIVVTAGAAQRLADRQPALVAEALEFASRTGRETLTALHRLVAVLRTADRDEPVPTGGRLEVLAAGFARLGQPVSVSLAPDLPTSGVTADALFGIAREALTNTLRYAPGAAVRVNVRRVDGVLELVVEDDGAAAGRPADSTEEEPAPLGSGLGLDGARERATAAGGSLTAGPKPDGGWRVCAVLPEEDVAVRGRGGRQSAWIREQRFADWALALAIAVLPLASVLAVDEAGADVDPSVGALVGLLMTAHGLPLLWRRNAPWTAFVGVLLTAWLWPLTTRYALLPSSMAILLGLACLAEFAAVYAVAAYARPKWASWLAVPPAAASLAAALMTAAAADGTLAGEPVDVPMAIAFGGFLAVAFAVLLAAVWAVGFAVRLRRERVLAREDTALTTVTAEASAATHAERLRIAAGLRQEVLHRAGRVVAVAEEGRLEDVITEARAGLAAMRELLGGLREDESAARRDPQATAAAIDALCREHRAAGRDIALESPAELPMLPPDVDVSAYRMVEAVLGAGDTGPARVALEVGQDQLRITVVGVPIAARSATVAGLRARTSAVGGKMAVDRAGTVRVWLPASRDPASIEEVAPSPSA